MERASSQASLQHRVNKQQHSPVIHSCVLSLNTKHRFWLFSFDHLGLVSRIPRYPVPARLRYTHILVIAVWTELVGFFIPRHVFPKGFFALQSGKLRGSVQ